jgi:hypothetical protein
VDLIEFPNLDKGFKVCVLAKAVVTVRYSPYFSETAGASPHSFFILRSFPYAQPTFRPVHTQAKYIYSSSHIQMVWVGFATT